MNVRGGYKYDSTSIRRAFDACSTAYRRSLSHSDVTCKPYSHVGLFNMYRPQRSSRSGAHR